MTATNRESSTTTTSYAQAYQLRTQNGHDVAIHHYQQLQLKNPHDTSAATRIAASEDSLRLLAKVGWPYCAQLDDEQCLTAKKLENTDWEGDIEKLHNLLYQSNYCHSSLCSHVFNPPPGEYPFGPTYIRPLVAGQGLDLSKLIESRPPASGDESIGSKNKWLSSLQCVSSLFLLSSCVPKHLLVESVIGGEETLELLLRLGIVFISRAVDPGNDEAVEDDWVVPLVHLFPLDIPPTLNAPNNEKSWRNKIVFMTDLHPTVLGMTSIPKAVMDHNTKNLQRDGNEEGAVMYIGPDSLALVHHLRASMPQYIENQTDLQSFGQILDVCTGSGVQALATLSMLDSLKQNNPDLAGMNPMATAVDINERALQFTRFNAHLNGYSDQIATVHADLLSGETYPKADEQTSNCGHLKRGDASLVEALLNTLAIGEKQQPLQHDDKREQKFDIFLANPPFIPVPPSRSDDAASSLRKNEMSCDSSTPRYGLFSSGGASGEDCLRAIVQLAPSVLRSDSGLFGVVSEFMNPPRLQSTSQKNADAKQCLPSKIEKWWSSTVETDSDADGILFTNEFAINSDIYAQRRAMNNDLEDVHEWKSHLDISGIYSVSPGLLFVETRNPKTMHASKGLNLKHQFVPKTKNGSIWTPHNYSAVEFTHNILINLFQ